MLRVSALQTHLQGVAVVLRCSMNASMRATRSSRELNSPAAFEDFAGQDREERFDLVQPWRADRGVVNHEP